MSHEREYKDTWEYRLESAERRAEQAEADLARVLAALRKLHHTEKGTCAFNLRSGCEYCAALEGR